jgi:hypothetical protein
VIPKKPGPRSPPWKATAFQETSARWSRTAAAKNLSMTLHSLRYRLSKLGID